MPNTPRDGRSGKRALLDVYTQDVTTRDLGRLFTRDARDAYRAFTGSVDDEEVKRLPWPKRVIALVHAFLMAFGLKLSPARRAIFGAALVLAILGFLQFSANVVIRDDGRGGHRVETRGDGRWLMLGSVALLNLLVILEVADRMSLKNDLEIARSIQQSMLPAGTTTVTGAEVHGATTPANTVGGDFYDIRSLPDGRLLLAVGDVAGKGSPAALLMALFLAMMRVLLDEVTDLVPLVSKLNSNIVRHTPGSRFITLFIGCYTPETGRLDYVNAGHPPALLRRANGELERLETGGVALGFFEKSPYAMGTTSLAPGDLLMVYSDGVTEAEHETRGFFDESGLAGALNQAARMPTADICRFVFDAVREHVDHARLGDDLTVLALRKG